MKWVLLFLTIVSNIISISLVEAFPVHGTLWYLPRSVRACAFEGAVQEEADGPESVICLWDKHFLRGWDNATITTDISPVRLYNTMAFLSAKVPSFVVITEGVKELDEPQEHMQCVISLKKLGLPVKSVEWRFKKLSGQLLPLSELLNKGERAIEKIKKIKRMMELPISYTKFINAVISHYKLTLKEYPLQEEVEEVKKESLIRILKKFFSGVNESFLHYALVFGRLNILEARCAYQIYNHREKSVAVIYEGGAHINRLMSLLKEIGYIKRARNPSQYFTKNSEQCILHINEQDELINIPVNQEVINEKKELYKTLFVTHLPDIITICNPSSVFDWLDSLCKKRLHDVDYALQLTRAYFKSYDPCG